MTRLFKETHYFPDYNKLIQNIINDCEVCNLAKTEHRPTKLAFEITPETNNPRELYVIDFYAIDNEQYLSCIDVYSKFASLIKTNSRDWLEAKRALTRIFNDMGKPQKIKADKDSAFMSNSLKIWLNNEEIQLDITTSKTGIADVERIHKTINEKIRIINTENNKENRETRIETILYTYNHKTKHNTTGQIPAYILLYAGTPTYDSQKIKENKINKLNENRQIYEVDTKYRQAPITRSKSKNPFRKTGRIEQLDEKHYNENNRGQNVTHYKSKFKNKKNVNNSKYLQPTDTQSSDS